MSREVSSINGIKTDMVLEQLESRLAKKKKKMAKLKLFFIGFYGINFTWILNVKYEALKYPM